MDKHKNKDNIEDNLERCCCHEEAMDGVALDEDIEQDESSHDSEDERLLEIMEELSKAREEREQYLSMAQRLQAEFDNFRKRNRAAVSEAYHEAKLETIKEFLPVLDNLDRALESSKDNDSDQVQAICKGVEMVIKQFTDILAKMGVEEIDALGQPFDPLYHDAVMQIEAEEDMEKNTVVEVLLKGYKSEDKVIRYSMVKVAN